MADIIRSNSAQNNLPKRKIGWIVHILVPEPAGEVGGAELHVLDLAVAQMQRSVYQPLVLITQNQEYADRLERAGISYFPGHTFKNSFEMIRALRHLPNALPIRMIHSHGYDCDYLTFLLRLIYPGSWGRIPVVMTCHGWIEDSLFHRIKTQLNFLIYHITADLLIICSPEQQSRLTKFAHKRSIKYIPNGIFLAQKRLKPKDIDCFLDRHAIPKGKLLVGSIGRLYPDKRRDVYLAICREIAIVLDNVHFLIIGSGPERKNLESLCRDYGIQDRVTFTGLIYDMDIVYEAVSLVLQTSDTESTSRVVLEATSHGLPVVATRVGGLDQQIDHGKTGYLVTRGDIHSFVQLSLDLLKSEEKRREFGKQAKIKAQYFSIWKMQNDVEDAYRYVLKRVC